MESFDEEFCDELDCYLRQALAYCDHKLARSCSMDGVLMPYFDHELYKKRVNDKRKINTTAWALSDKGDIRFNLTIHFGKYSLRRYARGSRLEDCLPPLEETSFVNFDFENHTIDLQLL